MTANAATGGIGAVSGVDPLDLRPARRPAAAAPPPAQTAALAALLRARREPALTDADAPADAPATVARPAPATPAGADACPHTVGAMRRSVAELVTLLETLPAPQREDRAALWALRGEARKLAALDEYVNGLIRG